MLVQVYLEKRAGKRSNEHAQAIVDDLACKGPVAAPGSAAIAVFPSRPGLRFPASTIAWLKRHEATMTRIDVTLDEITGKRNFLFDREMRREGSPEVR